MAKQPMQASNDGKGAGSPDGTNQVPGEQSQGGDYPSPERKGDESGPMGHGGQTKVGYHGGGQAGDDGEANVNAGARQN